MSEETAETNDAELKRQRDEMGILETSEEERKQKSQRRDADSEIAEALRLIKNGDHRLDRILYEQFPNLRESPHFWSAFLEAKMDKFPLLPEVFGVLFDYMPAAIFNDKDLMLKLCSYNSCFYSAIPRDHTLREDEDIVKVVLERNPHLVWDLSGTTQLGHPQLFGAALACLPLWHPSVCAVYQGRLDPGVWNIRDIVLGWAKGGGDLHNGIPQNFQEEFFFTYLNSKKAVPPIFVPDHLKSNKDFMVKAVEQNPDCLLTVGAGLAGDLDLFVAALSGESGNLVWYRDLHGTEWIRDGEESRVNRRYRFYFEIANHVRTKLYLHNVFFKLILCSIDSSCANESVFSVLDHGNETVKAFKQMLAEYAGVPFGKELGRLRRARESLAGFGLSWSDPQV